MIFSGKELKTYDDYEKYFHWMKCLTQMEVLDYLEKLEKSIEAPMDAKEYAHKRIEDQVRKYYSDYDGVLIVFTFSSFINQFLEEYA